MIVPARDISREPRDGDTWQQAAEKLQ